MSWTFVACVGIAFAWMGLFYLWGRGFLTAIHADIDIASCIPFGYLVLQVIYQIMYLPFLLSRGSFHVLSYSCFGVIVVTSVLLFLFLRRQSIKQKQRLATKEKVFLSIIACSIIGLAVYISLHVTFYGTDTRVYISIMNEAYYGDSIWVRSGNLSFHNGMCSMFHFFTVSSLLTGIKPYYIAMFTIRIIGVCLFSMIMYRTGVIVFQREKNEFNWSAAILAIIAPTLLMFWGSNYTAEFFYWRIYEAKGYCQFVLLPLGFSIFLDMFKETANRKALWKEQLLVGLAAIAVSSSSLTPYLFLVFIGTAALLAYDKFKGGWGTIRKASICAIPNVLYLILYILVQNQVIVF